MGKRISRRDALKALSLAGLSATVKGDSKLNGFARYERSARDLRYAPNPVAHGATTTWVNPTELKIASRIAPNTPLAFGPIEGTVQVLDESNEVVAAQRVQALTADDYRFTVNFPGLDPHTRYKYEIIADELGGHKFRGRTHSNLVRPKLVEGYEREFVRVAFANCMEYTRGFWNSFSTLESRNPDAVFFIGDTIYADVQQFILGDYVRDDAINVADEYEVFLLKYLSCNDEHKTKLLANVPGYFVPDDHEIFNNFQGGKYYPGDLIEDGYQAFSKVYASADNAEINGYQRSIDFGQGTRALLLDTRRHRNSSKATMLGEEQLEWLKRELTKCKADDVTRTLIITTVSFTAGSENSTEAWSAYSRERQQIIDVIANLDLKNVTFVSGDIHRFLAANVHLDPHNLNSPVIANEFEVGATSSNVSSTDNSWPNVEAFSKHSHGVMEADIYPDGTMLTRWLLYDAKKHDYVPQEAARFVNAPQSKYGSPRLSAHKLDPKLVGNPGMIRVLS